MGADSKECPAEKVLTDILVNRIPNKYTIQACWKVVVWNGRNTAGTEATGIVAGGPLA